MKLRQLLLRIAVGIIGSFFIVSVAAAATDTDSKTTTTKTDTKTESKTEAPAASLQGYASDKPLQIGTIVQLTGSGAAKVGPASQKKLEQMYGVVVDPHILTVTLSSSGLQNEAYVATTGTYNALVSDQGGAIKTGDYVTLSAIDGVLMKASAEEKLVFGRAANSFDGKSNVAGTAALKDAAGGSTQVHLGIASVAIDIRRNPNEKSTKANVPPWLQRLGEAVAEKPVGPMRIYLSMAITGLSIIVALVLLYSGVRSSIISIGRNPLSKKTIFRSLIEIILTSILVLIIGLFAVYLLLKL